MQNISYLTYKLSPREFLLYLVLFEAAAIITAHFFYDSIYPAIATNIFLKKYFNAVSNYLQNKREKKIRLEFLDFINSVSDSLNTGYSLENSINESLKPLSALYGENSILYREVLYMKKKLLINIPIETVFEDFGSRTGIDEIIAFSEVIKISKKGGGDMIAVIKSTITTIRAKIELTEDISATVSSKKYEQLVMMVMPFAIFAYIDITQPEFFSPLYHNLLGIIISSICLLIYIGSIFISKKILEIEV